MATEAEELVFKLVVLYRQHIGNREKVVGLWKNSSHLH